jgi:hypothetical protein
MPRPFWWTSLDSGIRVATVFLGFDRQGWITVFTSLLLALITLYGLRPTASTRATPMSTSWEPLPSIYRSKQEFLASLPPWRRLLQKLNWRPIVDLKVQRYAIEQEIKQLEIENARLAASNARLERFEREHLSGSIPHPSTGDSWSS